MGYRKRQLPLLSRVSVIFQNAWDQYRARERSSRDLPGTMRGWPGGGASSSPPTSLRNSTRSLMPPSSWPAGSVSSAAVHAMTGDVDRSSSSPGDVCGDAGSDFSEGCSPLDCDAERGGMMRAGEPPMLNLPRCRRSAGRADGGRSPSSVAGEPDSLASSAGCPSPPSDSTPDGVGDARPVFVSLRRPPPRRHCSRRRRRAHPTRPGHRCSWRRWQGARRLRL